MVFCRQLRQSEQQVRAGLRRREWLGLCAPLGLRVPLGVWSAGAVAPMAAVAQPSPRRPISTTIERVVAEALGRRRGGAVVARLHDVASPRGSGRDSVFPQTGVLMAGSGPNASRKLLDARQVLWRPGSTVKPFLLRTLLEGGQLRVTGEHRCKGKLRLDGRVFDCAHATQPAPLLGAEALALSCNEFFLHYAARLSIGGFAGTLSQAGFSDRQPFGEQCGPATVERPSDMNAHLLQCLGESHVLTTPLALLTSFRALVADIHNRTALAASVMLREGMAGCVRYGTGVGAQVGGLGIGGKTGTAGAMGGGHLNGWFLSYAPVETPRFVMVTFVEHASGGGEAAPLAARVWQALGDSGVFG